MHTAAGGKRVLSVAFLICFLILNVLAALKYSGKHDSLSDALLMRRKRIMKAPQIASVFGTGTVPIRTAAAGICIHIQVRLLAMTEGELKSVGCHSRIVA